ncbi:MAG: AAA family ATPase [Pseudomonadota bacterium]|nr:AAA family ATPase [Pseudomonadota bacterium]
MLTKFEVVNFKSFSTKISFNLGDTSNYSFNSECLKDGVVNKALIYGHNGVGKSNLGFAIMDIVSHLTDKNSVSQEYRHYLNALGTSEIAEFKYEFKLPHGLIEYSYGKRSLDTLVYEKLVVNGELFAEIDRRLGTAIEISAAGAESLARDIGDSQISIISYIDKNTVLQRNRNNSCFAEFLVFVNGMLFFRSLEGNSYLGLDQGRRSITKDIVERGNLIDFENFLNEAGIECKLDKINTGEDEAGIGFVFGKKVIPFYDIASQGTKSLALFYFWLQRLKETYKVSFLFIDEFDAFYHHTLSELIIRKLRGVSSQVVITTHNTSIMSNDLLRPDCYFLLSAKGLNSLANISVKELREAHNIEKMYKAGTFGG